ncbi:MAG: hypothetical protein H6660_12510 [Ardenticatenaceae bacterium]|nr:hypothetical protein [Ardenticatenaceae bacterium]
MSALHEIQTDSRRVFSYLLLYRWLSLIPPLVVWLMTGERPLLIASAIGANILISLVPQRLNKALRQSPWLLGSDLLLVALFVGLSGDRSISFLLYTLNPLLIAAFFFGLRGALLATAVLLPLYLAAMFGAAHVSNMSPDWLLIITWGSGLFLISLTFGYAASAVLTLRRARDELMQTNRDLEVINALTLSLQSASTVEEVQANVLEAITGALAFPRAVVGLADAEGRVLGNWLGRSGNGRFLPNLPLDDVGHVPLTPDGGLVVQAIQERRTLVAEGVACTTNTAVNEYVSINHCHIIPMQLREHTIGILLVDTTDSSDQLHRLASLEAIASQAAVAIGTTILCIDRARKLAVQEERIRIAQDIHDTVSQSLFGIVFTLDGCLKLLPEHVEQVIPELERTLQAADAVRQEIRHSILDLWPTQLTAERFAADLQTYAQETCQRSDTAFIFDIRGDFAALSPGARRGLYRIAQEALANIAHHAQAQEARVCVDVEGGRAKLVVRDDGRGFETAVVLARAYGREHFGLRGMQERAKTLGGDCQIFSKPGAGASIVVDIPV